MGYPPKRNTAYTFYVSLVSQANTKIMQANPTLAAGDVKVAVDDAAPANLTTLPVVDADFTKRIKVSISASEMNGTRITVIFSDAAGAEWCDLTIDIPTSVREIDDLAFPNVSGRGIDVDATGGVEITANQAVNAAQWAGVATASDDVAIVTAPTNFASLSITAGGLVDITQAAADKVWSSATRTLTAFSTALALSIWDVLESAIVTASSVGLKIKNNLDTAITSRSSHSAADVWAVGTRTLTSVGTLIADIWSYATRVLTAGTNIVLAKGTGVTGFNDLSAAQVNTECDTALIDYGPLKGGIAMTESYAADGAAATPEQILYMLWAALTEFAISGTSITCKKLNGSTTAMTFTLDDGTNPTSRTRST